MAVTRVTQSFKEKLSDGSFGEEVKLSTISDLVFYSDNKNLTQRTAEINQSIQDEENDRIEAINTVTNNLNQEIQDRKDAVSAEEATRKSEITRVEGIITSTKEELQGNIDETNKDLDSLADRVSTNELNINSIRETEIELAVENGTKVSTEYTDGIVAPINEIIGDVEIIKGDPLQSDYPLTIEKHITNLTNAVLQLMNENNAIILALQKAGIEVEFNS